MSWLTRLFHPHIELPTGLAERMRLWRERSDISERIPLTVARFIVVDVETSGLDTRRDRLLSIGACAVEALRLRAGEGFKAIRRYRQASELNNIPIHGISPQSQAAGEAPESASGIY